MTEPPAVTVEIAPTEPAPEPTAETPTVVVVDTGANDEGHGIDVDHAERIAVLENEIATLRGEVATATVTAEVASEIALNVATEPEPEPVVIETPEPAAEPEPDEEPHRDHFWHRTIGG